MLGGLLMVTGTLAISSVFYGIGKIHGYDQCDKDQNEFQGFWKEVNAGDLRNHSSKVVSIPVHRAKR